MRTVRCDCQSTQHPKRRVVLTGGPGAGKTAVLEIVRRHFCEHLAVLPESASIIFGGGFPRWPTDGGRRAAQRAIFHVQTELERLAEEEKSAAVTLCDRGTVDGAAYWPGSPESFFASVGTTQQEQLARYDAVIHLQTPPLDGGYNRSNPLRIESAAEAMQIDAVIAALWSAHPRRFVVASSDDFLDKAARALGLLREEVPACCRPD